MKNTGGRGKAYHTKDNYEVPTRRKKNLLWTNAPKTQLLRIRFLGEEWKWKIFWEKFLKNIRVLRGLWLFKLSFYTWLLLTHLPSYIIQKPIPLGQTLLENRLLTSIIKDFQHQLLTDVETTDVKSLNVNISFPKLMLSKLHNIGFIQNWYPLKK